MCASQKIRTLLAVNLRLIETCLSSFFDVLYSFFLCFFFFPLEEDLQRILSELGKTWHKEPMHSAESF